MDSNDVLAAGLGRVASQPRARHRYGGTCDRCGRASRTTYLGTEGIHGDKPLLVVEGGRGLRRSHVSNAEFADEATEKIGER